MVFEHDRELASETLQWSQEQLGMLADSMHDETEQIDLPTSLFALAAIQKRLTETTKTLAVHAVEGHHITRKKAAEILKVHHITVSRWIAANEVEQQ